MLRLYYLTLGTPIFAFVQCIYLEVLLFTFLFMLPAVLTYADTVKFIQA
jgi:hypothetical protein